jgi:putative membrane protein
MPGEHPQPDRVIGEGAAEYRREGFCVWSRDITDRIHGPSVSCNDRYVKILIRVVTTAIALWVATLIVSGIDLTTASTPRKVGTLVVVAVVFGLINAFLKPIVKTLGCVFYILTLGLFALVVNGLLLWLASWAADKMNLPFHVSGFWAAFWGAIVVGLVSWLLNLFVHDDKPAT